MKSSKIFKLMVMIVTLSIGFGPLGIAQTPDVLPEIASFIEGGGSIEEAARTYYNGNVAELWKGLVVNLYGNRNVSEWWNFSIGGKNFVDILQESPDATALMRVIGSNPSEILGRLNATGKIFLVNPNGILFGKDAVVDAAGIVASTLDISNEDFMAGRYVFFGEGGKVENAGYIRTPGGFAILLGNTVKNMGVIEATLGTVILAAGEALTLNLDPQGDISVVIDKGLLTNPDDEKAAVENTGTIIANGGKVILTAKVLNDVFDQAVNNEGIIEAKSLVDNKGEVYLLGKDSGSAETSNTGTIDVSGMEDGAEGGFAEVSGSRLYVGGDIILDGNNAADGELLLDPLGDWYLITDGAVARPDGSSVVLESTWEGLSGTTNIIENGFFEFRLDETWNGAAWVDFGTGDNTLNLSGINAGERFFLRSLLSYINFFNDSVITGGGDLLFIAGGEITSQADSLLTANNLGLFAQDGIKVQTDVNVLEARNSLSNDIIIKNLGDLKIKDISNQKRKITLTSTGKIESEAGTRILSKELDIEAVGGIDVDTQIADLKATNTGSGDLDVTNDLNSLFNPTGDLKLDDIVNLGRDISISTPGDLTSKAGTSVQGKNADLTSLNGLIAVSTQLDGLSAFASKDITIDELDDIELGLIDSSGMGHSVASANGVIRITSGGDMLVNSIIAPRGGVFLESTSGSIYAGQGWCPESSSAGPYTIDLTGTDWKSSTGINYFYYKMAGALSKPGPNIISGGYSYFSTPNGTVGVGTPAGPAGPSGDATPVAAGDNPLWVNIQVITANLLGNNSAVPVGVYTGVPVAGLTMKLGGTVASLWDDGSNGLIGESGDVKGIVRPGTTDINAGNPSPALYGYNTDAGVIRVDTPPGYVFYQDTDATCAKLFDGTTVGNTPIRQIWPDPITPPTPNPELQSFDGDIFEVWQFRNLRFVSVQPARQFFYFYHPLTPMDASAFDGIALDAGAYEYIEGALKHTEEVSPYYGFSEESKMRTFVNI